MSHSYSDLFPTINTVLASGRIRVQPQDFQVTEINAIDFSGSGEHLWLYIEKTGSNTDWVAKQLADCCQVPAKQVGYAGLKDRHAVTRQWFSVQLPQVDNIEELRSKLPDEVCILKAHRHNKKLKTGGLKGNQFKIIVRNVDGDRQQVESNIKQIKKWGVPNYFGEQRFGYQLGNVSKAEDWFFGKFKPKSRHLKSLLLSTARSWIFNHIVAERVSEGYWLKPMMGDIYQLDGSHSWFADDREQFKIDEIVQRLAEQDIHITAALWGDNKVQSHADTAIMEQRVAEQFPMLLAGMNKHRLKQERRNIRMRVNDLEASWDSDKLVLDFCLSAGSYATAVLRELLLLPSQ